MGAQGIWNVVVGVLLSTVLTASELRADKGIRLRFPNGVDLTGLSISYFLTGPFGGFGSYVRTSADVREYAVDTSRDGHPAEAIKLIVYCPGYQVVLFERCIADGPTETVPILLEPLEWSRLSGRVLGIANPERVSVDVIYLADWSHAFFGIVDGAIASFTVASTTLGPDGSFVVRVPDLANDSVVAIRRPSERGRLWLTARKTGTNVRYRLESVNNRDAHLPIAEEYADLLLVAVAL